MVRCKLTRRLRQKGVLRLPEDDEESRQGVGNWTMGSWCRPESFVKGSSPVAMGLAMFRQGWCRTTVWTDWYVELVSLDSPEYIVQSNFHYFVGGGHPKESSQWLFELCFHTGAPNGPYYVNVCPLRDLDHYRVGTRVETIKRYTGGGSGVEWRGGVGTW